MKRKEIIDAFKKQREEFALLSSSVMRIIQEKLKLVINECPHPPGGFQWVIQKGDHRATLEMYSDGTVLLYTQTKLSLEDMATMNTKRTYSPLKDEAYDVFQLTDEFHLDRIVTEIKKFLI